MLYRPICPDLRLAASRNEAVRVRLIGDGEVDLWAQTAFEGWSEFVEVADFLRDLGQVVARSKTLSFLAEQDGKPIATGSISSRCQIIPISATAWTPTPRSE